MNNQNFGNEQENIFHSSAYAEAAHGSSIGSTSSQTFGQRYHVERNRSSVRSYRDSHIARGTMGHHNYRMRTDPVGRIDSSAMSSMHSQSNTGSTIRPVSSRFNSPAPRTGFREPPARYNPYA